MAVKIKPKAKLVSVGKAKKLNAPSVKAKSVKGNAGKSRKGEQKDGTYALYGGPTNRGPKSK